MSTTSGFVEAIGEACPGLHIASCRLLGSGFVNDVVIVNEELLFRFPRNSDGLTRMHLECQVLRLLEGHTSLAIPHLEFVSASNTQPGKAFSGYRKIEGEPVANCLGQIDSGTAMTRIAPTLARFLRELHSPELLVHSYELPEHNANRRKGLFDFYQQTRASLYPRMTFEACSRVTNRFEHFLADDRNFSAENRLRHGDLNPNNVLIKADSWMVTGIIDFGSTGLDDPATDLGQVMSWSHLAWGVDFGETLLDEYGATDGLRKRANFYKSLIALIVAQGGLQSDDQEAIANGLSML